MTELDNTKISILRDSIQTGDGERSKQVADELLNTILTMYMAMY